MTNIVKIQTTFNDINLPAQAIWYSGCGDKCPGCHNESLKKERQGMSLQQIEKILKERRQLSEWVVYLGGEPLDYPELIKKVSSICYKYSYKQIIFTGFETHELCLNVDILKHIDFIKIGRYKENDNELDYHFASTNQSLYRIKNGIIYKKVYYYKIDKKIEEIINEN